MKLAAYILVGLLLLASLGYALMSAQRPNDTLDKLSIACSVAAMILMFGVTL